MEKIVEKSGHTEAEQEVSDKLLEVINLYFKLPKQHPSDVDEFIAAAHAMQQLLGMRVLRREHPKQWPTPAVEEQSRYTVDIIPKPIELRDGPIFGRQTKLRDHYL